MWLLISVPFGIKQDISHVLEVQLERIAEAMYNHLVSPNRDVENVTEWAKREACWKKAKQLDVTLSKEFLSELVSRVKKKKIKKLWQGAKNLTIVLL